MTSATDAFDACVREAALQADDLMRGLVVSGLQQMFRLTGAKRMEVEHAALQRAVRLLEERESFLRHRFRDLLLAEFTSGGRPAEQTTSAPASISFDTLELMDDTQVQERVELARIEQSIQQVAETELEELNRLICGAQGLDSVQAERNPMRPEVYARTLHAALEQTGEPGPVRLLWIQALGEPLGAALAIHYRSLCHMLREAGVVPAGYLVVKAPAGAPEPSNQSEARQPSARTGSPGPTTQSGPQHKLLTLAHLRRLLAREPAPDPRNAGEPGDPEPSADEPEFSQTVPAAFEALHEMKQVDAVIRRLAARRQAESRQPAGTSANRAGSSEQFATPAPEGGPGWGQALALEVVALMIDNLAGDVRLVEPVRMVVKALHPSLTSLALKDPRFFSDRQHPARRLLAEITERGLAFGSADADGFDAFIRPVIQVVEQLALAEVENAGPFEVALSQLHEHWAEQVARERERRDKAVQALVQAERRTLLASRISHELRERGDLAGVAPEVVGLLVGPWAQVMAQARLNEAVPGGDPGGYGALVPRLLWSAQPLLARQDRAGLVAMVPDLIRTLRQGLRSIDFPMEQEHAFLDVLMRLHQEAMTRVETSPPAASHGPMSRSDLEARFDQADDSELWVVAREAQDSGYFDSMPPARPGEAAMTEKAVDMDPTGRTNLAIEAPPMLIESAPPRVDPGGVDALIQLGAWIEFHIDAAWHRSQLTWTNPRGNLFMFTGASGRVQSMTLRSLTRLHAQGNVRLVATQSLMDTALDEVARTALQNSVQEDR